MVILYYRLTIYDSILFYNSFLIVSASGYSSETNSLNDERTSYKSTFIR